MENNVITHSNLILQATIPAFTQEKFQEITIKAKEMCPVGNALNVEINLEASVIQQIIIFQNSIINDGIFF